MGKYADNIKTADNGALVADIFDNMRRLFQAMNEYSKKAERKTGLTGPQLWTIKVIAKDAPIRISDLARKMYLHPATVVGIIDRLESRGIVERIRCRKDRRVVTVNLTAKGLELVANAPEVAQGLIARGLEGLPKSRLKMIADSFDQFVHILGAQDIPPQLILSPEVNQPVRRSAKS